MKYFVYALIYSDVPNNVRSYQGSLDSSGVIWCYVPHLLTIREGDWNFLDIKLHVIVPAAI